MRGISKLRERGVPFHVIAVVTAETIRQGAAPFAEFMAALGAEEIGLNFEEQEGINDTSSLDPPEVSNEMRGFLTDLVALAADQPGLRLREMRMIAEMLRDPAFGTRDRNSENAPFSIVTVDVGGGLYTFSPELAGQSSERYSDYRLGDVYSDRLSDIIAREPFLSLDRDIAQGVARCKEDCAYFRLCLGGAPSNKIAELRTMCGTETLACRHYKQAVSDVVLKRLEQDLGVSARAWPGPHRQLQTWNGFNATRSK